MKSILILEDDEERIRQFQKKLAGHHVVIVETAAQAIRHLRATCWHMLFLDHDLGGQVFVESGPGTGYEVATWLETNQDRKPGIIILHSMNPVGRDHMQQALPGALQVPGAWLCTLSQLQEIVEHLKKHDNTG